MKNPNFANRMSNICSKNPTFLTLFKKVLQIPYENKNRKFPKNRGKFYLVTSCAEDLSSWSDFSSRPTALQVVTQPSTDLATSLAASISCSWQSGSLIVGATTLAHATNWLVLSAHWVAAPITWKINLHIYRSRIFI